MKDNEVNLGCAVWRCESHTQAPNAGTPEYPGSRVEIAVGKERVLKGVPSIRGPGEGAQAFRALDSSRAHVLKSLISRTTLNWVPA